MEVKNYMEIVVREALKQVLANMTDVCQCERCRLDMMALALNNLAPRYTVSHTGEVFTKLRMWDADNQVKILAEVTKAAMQVAAKPNHS